MSGVILNYGVVLIAVCVFVVLFVLGKITKFIFKLGITVAALYFIWVTFNEEIMEFVQTFLSFLE